MASKKKAKSKAPKPMTKPVTVDNVRMFIAAVQDAGVTNNHVAEEFRITIADACREMRFLWRGGWVKRVQITPNTRVPCGLSWRV